MNCGSGSVCFYLQKADQANAFIYTLRNAKGVPSTHKTGTVTVVSLKMKEGNLRVIKTDGSVRNGLPKHAKQKTSKQGPVGLLKLLRVTVQRNFLSSGLTAFERFQVTWNDTWSWLKY